jgi:hypothetical protein
MCRPIWRQGQIHSRRQTYTAHIPTDSHRAHTHRQTHTEHIHTHRQTYASHTHSHRQTHTYTLTDRLTQTDAHRAHTHSQTDVHSTYTLTEQTQTDAHRAHTHSQTDAHHIHSHRPYVRRLRTCACQRVPTHCKYGYTHNTQKHPHETQRANRKHGYAQRLCTHNAQHQTQRINRVPTHGKRGKSTTHKGERTKHVQIETVNHRY